MENIFYVNPEGEVSLELEKLCNGEIKDLEYCRKSCPEKYQSCRSYIFEENYQKTNGVMLNN